MMDKIEMLDAIHELRDELGLIARVIDHGEPEAASRIAEECYKRANEIAKQLEAAA